MQKLRGGFTLFLAFALLTACNDDPTEPEPDPDEYGWTATLQGTEGWDHLSGAAEVVWVEGQTEFEASASIAGDESGAVRPWHVHYNTCAEGGAIVGADGDYPRLNVDEDGTADVSTTVPEPMDTTASFHVNIHLSESEMGTIIACGDLNMQGN